MSRAYVLMTAMPPTKGHLHLIQFAAKVGDTAEVIVTTQPSEPYPFERLQALRDATAGMNVNIHHIHKELPQEPVGQPFWDMWVDFLLTYGFRAPDDFIVASEMYGKTLADLTGTRFVPYDLNREVYGIRATQVREDPIYYFDHVLPEFQPLLRKRVTIFGAESTGKTTLAKSLAQEVNGHFIPEWARQYLMEVDRDISVDSMTAIWRGQKALQEQAADLVDKPFIIQDTDLYSTYGYWKFWDASSLPFSLLADALESTSDLYLITQSNIPFEKDPIRYGGDKREQDDAYWINLAETMNLNYRVIQSDSPEDRLEEAAHLALEFYEESVDMKYDRIA